MYSLEDKAIYLLAGDRYTAYRLILNQAEHHPNETLEWYWEKLIYDIERGPAGH